MFENGAGATYGESGHNEMSNNPTKVGKDESGNALHLASLTEDQTPLQSKQSTTVLKKLQG